MIMRTITSILCLASVLLSGCGPAKPSGPITPVSFYIVSQEKIEGGRFIDTEDFPKLGYIAAAPDLVITRLLSVAPVVTHQQSSMVDKDGKETALPSETKSEIAMSMRADDAKNFTTLTGKAVGKELLMMLGETPIVAPRIGAAVSLATLTLTLPAKADKKKIEDGLKKLVY